MTSRTERKYYLRMVITKMLEQRFTDGDAQRKRELFGVVLQHAVGKHTLTELEAWYTFLVASIEEVT